MTRRRVELLWLALPIPARLTMFLFGLALACLVALAFLSGCALQQFSPYAGFEMKDEATRQADPSWRGIGQLWMGIKAVF